MSKVISLNNFKHKKEEKITQEFKDTNNFGDRINKIKTSLKRINSLMAELKQMSHKPTRESDEEII